MYCFSLGGLVTASILLTACRAFYDQGIQWNSPDEIFYGKVHGGDAVLMEMQHFRNVHYSTLKNDFWLTMREAHLEIVQMHE